MDILQELLKLSGELRQYGRKSQYFRECEDIYMTAYCEVRATKPLIKDRGLQKKRVLEYAVFYRVGSTMIRSH